MRRRSEKLEKKAECGRRPPGNGPEGKSIDAEWK
jgi:hypothetical protein